MFEEINKYKIRVHQGKGIHYIPNVISIGPLEELFKATGWLFQEAVNDYNTTYQIIEDRRRKAGYSQKNIDDIDNLGIRLGSRTQGYVNQICLMEDILIYEYDRMAELVKDASDNKIFINAKSDYQALIKRLTPIRTFRNKVVAHTAYTYPKINKKTGQSEDNPETIVRSILNLFPKQGGITLGNNFYSGFSKWVSQLPIITIFNWEQEIRPVLDDWKNLFITTLESIHTHCPYQNKSFHIEIASPHLVRKRSGK